MVTVLPPPPDAGTCWVGAQVAGLVVGMPALLDQEVVSTNVLLGPFHKDPSERDSNHD
jgi:hypothetical protein